MIDQERDGPSQDSDASSTSIQYYCEANVDRTHGDEEGVRVPSRIRL